MNWDAISFDWNQVRAFLATAEEGSFSAAARALGLTQPTLGRQVAGLEDALGIALFERIGRSLSLTPSGRELLEHVRVMAEAAGRVSLVASGQAQDVSGRVMITASDVLSAYHLPPILKELRAVAPALEIEVVATSDIRDLQRREADIAIRHVRPQQPELFARLVREETANLYASGAYLDARGRPKDLTALSAHDFVGFGDVDRMIAYMEPLGIHLDHENFRANCALGLVSWALARQGLGIAAMSDLVAAQCPEMERVLPTMEPITFPVWLTTHRELHTSRRIRLVFDVLADGLARGAEAEAAVA